MATLNETFTNDEDYAMILQSEEMSMSNIRNLVTRQTNDASRSKLPNYVCIEDEIITIDDDDDDYENNVDSDSIIDISSNTYNNDEKDDLLKKDELMAKQLQEELDKEMAESLQSKDRMRRTDPTDFQIDSTSPFHNRSRTRPRNSINDIMSSNIETTNRYRPHRHLNVANTSDNNRIITSTDDLYQSSLAEFFRHEAASTRNNQNIVNAHVTYFNQLSRLASRDYHGQMPNNRTNRINVLRFANIDNDFSSNDYENLLQLDEMNVKKGLSREELNSLPKFEFKLCSGVNESDRTCSICQDEFENKSELTALTCTHKFHFKCIKEWLNQSRRCPLCTKDAINGN